VRTSPAPQRAPVVRHAPSTGTKKAHTRKKAAHVHKKAAPVKQPTRSKTTRKRSRVAAVGEQAPPPIGIDAGPGPLDWLLFVGLPLTAATLIVGGRLVTQRRQRRRLASGH
jgi:hypothetical protein